MTFAGDVQIQQFSSSLPMMLYRALDVLMPRFRKILRAFELTEQQWRVLRVLWERNELLSRELATLTLIPPSSLVGIVSRLEKRDLVARRRDDSDRRAVFVGITAQGQALKADVTSRVDAVYREIRNAVQPDVWDQLLHGLDCVCRIDHAETEPTALTEK